MPATENKRPGFKLVRWIMVITLGCSLGLLYVFAVLSTRQLVREKDQYETFEAAGPRSAIPLKLSETNMQRQLTRVIEAQLIAFRKDDYPEAYTYAATPLRAQMPLPAFERMVKLGYSFIAHSRSADFGAVLDNGENAVVNVTITSASGEARHYQYLLEHESGGWKIFGVTLIKPVGITV